MEKTPQDRNIIATWGRNPYTEDEVYRILDLKDFSTIAGTTGDAIEVSPGSTTSITNYPIYETLLQLPYDYTIKPSVFSALQRPWAVIDGTSFGWYARTLLTTVTVPTANAEALIAVNLDDTSEHIVFPIGGYWLDPYEDFIVRSGFVYSGFLKLNKTTNVFEADTTFTVTLPNGQIGTTTFSNTSFIRGFKTEQFVYLVSYFTAAVGSGMYMCKINKTGSFNLEALYLLDTLNQPARILAVDNLHVWWAGGSSGHVLKKYVIATGVTSSYSTYTSFSQKDIFWPQPDGTLAWFNDDWNGSGDLVFTLRWISLTGVVTTEAYPLTFSAGTPFQTVSSDTWFKATTNEYFFSYYDIYSTETTVVKVSPFTPGVPLTYSIIPFPSQVAVDTRWSTDNYGGKVRWLGSDLNKTFWAFYEMSI